MENSIFHRQKFVWRRQRGCDFVPILCKPCKFTGSIFKNDCPAQSTLCDIYPKGSEGTGGFTNVLKYVVDNWFNKNFPLPTTLETSGCDVNTINSVWFVDLNINGTILQYPPFFNGLGYYNTPGQSCLPATPCLTDWTTALDFALSQLITLGYDYRYEHGVDDDMDLPPTKVRLWNTNCSDKPLSEPIEIKMGINFTISCTI
jgi:hypothetical protein